MVTLGIWSNSLRKLVGSLFNSNEETEDDKKQNQSLLLRFYLRNMRYVTARYVTYVTQGDGDEILR